MQYGWPKIQKNVQYLNNMDNMVTAEVSSVTESEFEVKHEKFKIADALSWINKFQNNFENAQSVGQ